MEFCDGILQGGWGFWRFPALALDVQLGVVGVFEDAWVGCPESLSLDVLGEPVNGVVQLGFGECWLEAEFKAMPEEFCCAWGWWDGGAEVVETAVGLAVQVVELGQGHPL